MEEIKSQKEPYYKSVLIILILLLGLIIFKEIKYYLGGLLAAVAMYSLLKKQMINLTEKHKISRGLSALIIVFASIVFILIPLIGIGVLAADTISGINLNPGDISSALDNFALLIERKFDIEIFVIKNLSFVPKVWSNIMQSIVSGLSSMVINSFIAIFVLYFMLVRFDHFEKVILEILHFSENNKEILRQETKSIIISNTIGIPVVALTQGVLAYIGYLSIGVSSPLVFAVLIAFTTVIPVVGTSIIWVPIGISALLSGNLIQGVFLLAYGLLIIGGSDAIIRFILQKKLANIHPLITFFGVLIGLAIFGFWGIIFGPLLLSLFMLLLNMYRHDYIIGSEAKPHITTKENSKNILFIRKNRQL